MVRSTIRRPSPRPRPTRPTPRTAPRLHCSPAPGISDRRERADDRPAPAQRYQCDGRRRRDPAHRRQRRGPHQRQFGHHHDQRHDGVGLAVRNDGDRDRLEDRGHPDRHDGDAGQRVELSRQQRGPECSQPGGDAHLDPKTMAASPMAVTIPPRCRSPRPCMWFRSTMRRSWTPRNTGARRHRPRLRGA